MGKGLDLHAWCERFQLSLSSWLTKASTTSKGHNLLMPNKTTDLKLNLRLQQQVAVQQADLAYGFSLSAYASTQGGQAMSPSF